VPHTADGDVPLTRAYIVVRPSPGSLSTALSHQKDILVVSGCCIYSTRKAGVHPIKARPAQVVILHASPTFMHAGICQLFEAGIIVHKQGEYSALSRSSSTPKIKFDGSYYDALVVSRIFDRKVDPLVSSISREALHVDPRIDFPVKEKLHIFPDKSGKMSSMISHGLESNGTDHRGSKYAVQEFDCLDRAGACEDSPQSALVIGSAILSDLNKALNPMEAVQKVYFETLPSRSAYEREVHFTVFLIQLGQSSVASP